MPLDYQDFDLLITPAPVGYSSRVIRSPAGEAHHTFTLPFSAADLAGFHWLPRHTLRHLTFSAAPSTPEDAPALDARAFGARLYTSVFGESVGQLFRRSLDRVQAAASGLRIRLRLHAVPELAEWPWEYLFAPDLDRFLALSAQTPLVRYLDLSQPPPQLTISPPLRILAIAANPTDAAKLDLAREWEILQTALKDLTARNACILEKLEPPTMPALQQRLRGAPVHIIHFMGHGYFDAQQTEGGLVFADATGHSRRVPAQVLATLCHDHPALRLFVLNACEGATTTSSAPFAGVAQRLVQQGTPAVMAMQFPVSDMAALALAQEFYTALAGMSAGDPSQARPPLPIDAALAEARKAVYLLNHTALPHSLEWGTPVLYTRAPDGILLAPASDTTDAESHPQKEQPAMPDATPTSQSRPWWEQLPGGETRLDSLNTGNTQGDVIIATVGAGARNVAVGKQITQQIYEIVGEPTPDDRQLIHAQLAQVQAALAAISTNDSRLPMAEFQLQLLEGELSKTEENETPSATTIMAVGDWLLDNLPDLTETLAALFVTPAVGRVVGKAGEALVSWVRKRFGTTP